MTLPFQRAVLKRRLGRIVVEGVDGVDILVLPETFNPVVFRSGAFFAAALEAVIASPAGSAQAVLDMGAGSGVGAVFAARAGAMVTAVDINSEACRCARINAAIHGLEDRITVLEGDLFAPVAGRRFDVVLFNPPFFRGTPKSNLDRAWRSEDVLERFARGVGSVLAPGGRVAVVLSSHGEGDRLIRLLAGERFASRIVRQRDFGTEVMRVYEAWRLAR
jgi:HemK-related putative methylase